MPRFDNFMGYRRDEAPGSLIDISARVTSLEAGQQGSTGVTVGQPEVDSTFAPLYDRTDKRGVYVTLRFFIPGDTYELKIVLIERALATTETNFLQKRLKTDLATGIEDSHRAAGSIEDRLDQRLKYATQYDVIKLTAISDNNTRVSNPTNTDFSGYPGNSLFTFTTPERFNTPSAPDASLILYNRLDEQTSDVYDAIVGLLQYAPLTDAGAAQSYRTAGVIEAGSILTRPVTGQADERLKFQRTLDETELDQVADGVAGRPLSSPAGRGYVVIPCPGLPPGRLHTWVENFIRTMQDKKRTTGSVAFRAASLQVDITALTNTALTITAPDSSVTDGKHVQFNLEFTQPNNVAGAASTAQAVALKNGTLKLKKTSDTAYKNLVDRWNECQADIYHTKVNTGTVSGNTGTTTVTGVGTEFTKLQAGWKLIVGAQTFTIANTPTSDTSLTITALPGSNFTAQNFTVVYVVPITQKKVKPSTGYSPGAEFILRARGDQKVTLTTNFTTDADGNIAQDTSAPVIGSAPKFKYKNGGFICRLNAADLSQVNSLSKVELTINNASNSLNLSDLDLETAASGIVYYDQGQQVNLTITISKDQIYKIFGTTGDLHCTFKLTNSQGTTTSSDSDTLSLATGLKEKSKRTNPQQLFQNPGFTQDDGVGNVDKWIDFGPNSNSIGTIQTGSGSLRWDDANARVFWHDNSATAKRYLAQDMGITMLPSDAYAVRFFVESNGSLTINFDMFIAVIFTATGTADPDGTTTLLGTGTAFLTEIAADDEITVNSETRTVQSVTDDTHLVVTSAFSNTAGSATIYVVRPKSELIQMGNQNLTSGAEKRVEAIFTHEGGDMTLTRYVMFRPNGTISAAGPYLYFERPSFVLGLTPAEFTLGHISIPDFDTTPTGGGGTGQESSGENPGGGGFEILLT